MTHTDNISLAIQILTSVKGIEQTAQERCDKAIELAALMVKESNFIQTAAEKNCNYNLQE